MGVRTAIQRSRQLWHQRPWYHGVPIPPDLSGSQLTSNGLIKPYLA